MKVYPAMRATQGSWEYFVVKMCIKELAKEVSLAREFHENKILDEIIHRKLSQEKIVAIRMLIDQKNRHLSGSSGEIGNEEISVVIFVFRDKDEKCLERYEKIRSNMNRLAALSQAVDSFLQSSDQPSKLIGTDEEKTALNLARDRKS